MISTVSAIPEPQIDKMDKYIKYSDIPFCKIELEERCHNDRWTEIHEVAYKTEIDRIPAADVAPVIHGKWINPHWQDSTHCMNCNQCKYEAQHRAYHGVEKYYRYCPNCGAKMDGDGE